VASGGAIVPDTLRSAPYTASAALLDALNELGIEYIFANFGSDHPGLVESISEARAAGRAIPAIVTCPNEMVGMSAAHGFAAVTGRAQAVMVHVECGTQALAGAIHNAAKGRVPVFIFAGTSPITQEGELKGSRNEFIQWIQDVHDQRGIVRGYMRYDNEIRSGANIKQLVARALQIASSDPKGPVYIIGAREVMEATAMRVALDPRHWKPVAPAGLSPEDVAEIADALVSSRHALVVTSFIGRNPAAVEELTRLCQRLGLGVLESVPNYVNFSHDNPLYQGNQWNEPQQNTALAIADVVLVIDSDVPWIPAVNTPNREACIYHIDVDPLKRQMPLWYLPTRKQFAADALTTLRQISAHLDTIESQPALIAARRHHWAERNRAHRAALSRREAVDRVITPEYLTAALRSRLDETALIVLEGISNYQTIINHLALTRPGSLFTSGGGSLGWHGGAAIGAKLACPERMVIALCGDGSYMFSVPSSVHWMARRYGTPFLTIIYNNGGWKSPKLSTLAVHPDGFASRASELDMSFEPQADYSAIAAAAGGALAATVEHLDELDDAFNRCLHAVRIEKRCAVMNVRLPAL
jgi:acetolactate synthase-1/2/3 large subunit